MRADLQALRIIALKNVMVGSDADAEWRHVCRWYSKTFHTPLAEVDDLPTFDVWQAFFEDRAENMDDEERQKELEEILSPNGLEKALIKSHEDSAMDDLVAMAKAENAKAKEAKGLKEHVEDLGKAVDDIKTVIENTGEFNLDFDGLG
jgi:hypothetical protein